MNVAQFPGNCFFLSGIFFRRFQALPPGCPVYLVPYAASSLIVHTIWVGRFRFDCTVSLTVVCGQRKEGAVMVFILSKIKCFFRLLQSAALHIALSGGQRQRVALARAMVRAPKLFLMDEPLSNLDAKLRVQMRREITALQRKLGTTTIYVTHDQTEAMTMGDRIAIFKDGVVQQMDTPQMLYQKPANLFVAGFIGSPPMNIWKEGEKFCGIRPEHIHITENPDHIRVRVVSVEWTGRETVVFADTENLGNLGIVTDAVCSLKVGDMCYLALDKQFIHFFDGETGGRI